MNVPNINPAVDHRVDYRSDRYRSDRYRSDRHERTVELARPDVRPDYRLDVRPAVEETKSDRHGDSATISDESRVRMDAVKDYTDRLMQPDRARQQKLDEVRARLDAGDLDRADVFRAAAHAILRGLR